jgi:hypothetical protein
MMSSTTAKVFCHTMYPHFENTNMTMNKGSSTLTTRATPLNMPVIYPKSIKRQTKLMFSILCFTNDSI